MCSDFVLPVYYARLLPLRIETRKALLTQRETRNSGACLKAQYNKISRQRAPDDWRINIYSVLLVLTRGHYLSRSANAVSAQNRKFSLPFSHLVLSFGVTPFEFI